MPSISGLVVTSMHQTAFEVRLCFILSPLLRTAYRRGFLWIVKVSGWLDMLCSWFWTPRSLSRTGGSWRTLNPIIIDTTTSVIVLRWHLLTCLGMICSCNIFYSSEWKTHRVTIHFIDCNSKEISFWGPRTEISLENEGCWWLDKLRASMQCIWLLNFWRSWCESLFNY